VSLSRSLKRIIRSDNEYLDALKAAEALYVSENSDKDQMIRGLLVALGQTVSSGGIIPTWATPLLQARKAPGGRFGRRMDKTPFFRC
jgi:hypothetical protein